MFTFDYCCNYYRKKNLRKSHIVFIFKYDGHWVNGKLHGPVNMILANHVYLGHFLENRVSYLLKHSILSVN